MEEKLNDVVLEDVVGGAGTTDTKVKIEKTEVRKKA